jgi:hypothetical protein
MKIQAVQFIAIASFGLLLGLSPAAVTTAAAETPEQRQACTHDAFRLCSDAMPDVERTKACLLRNRASLSGLCRSAFSTARPGTRHPKAGKKAVKPAKPHHKH